MGIYVEKEIYRNETANKSYPNQVMPAMFLVELFETRNENVCPLDSHR